MNPLLFGILGYVALQLCIGAWVSRSIRSEDDFLLAGRSLGYGLATFSIFATWFGAETCLGAAGQVYDDGLSLGSTEPFAYGVCLVVMGLVFARPLWKRKLTTLADLFRQRYSTGVERFAAVLMIPTSVLWAGAQIRALGQVMSTAAGIEVEVGIVVAATIVIAYTTMGGLMADAISDVIQGIAVMVGLGAITWGVVDAMGGFGAAVATIDPARVRATLPSEWTLLDGMEAWAVPILGSVVAQELVARVSAARGGHVAQRATLMAATIYIAVGSLPIFLGLLGAGLLPALEDHEQILPRLAMEMLPTWGYVLFAGALVSAILSTVDSTLLVASSLLSHNLVLPLRGGATSEAEKVRWARMGVVSFGAIATILAWRAESVSSLVHEASALGSAGILVVVVFGLFTRFGGASSAFGSLSAGALWYAGAVAFEMPLPYLGSLGAALTAYLSLGVLRPPRLASSPS